MSGSPRAKTNGANAYGKSEWSWLPLLQSSFLRRRFEPNRVQGAVNSRSDGDKRRIRRRGEFAISRQATAQGRPGVVGCTCMLVCDFLKRVPHTRPRVQRAPGLPCALCLEEGVKMQQSSDAMRREKAEARLLGGLNRDLRCCRILSRHRPTWSGDPVFQRQLYLNR